MKVYAKTDKGVVRKTNQDAFAVREMKDGTVIAIVCDGMGGVNGGEEASAMTVDTVIDIIASKYDGEMTKDALETLLDESISKANELVKREADRNESKRGMGTTAVVAVAKNDEVTVAFVGDSRAYIISQEDIRMITHDHSFVQAMVDMGQITEEEAKIHPHRNIITRAVGSEDTVAVDINTAKLSQGEIVLICTDGLSGSVEAEQMAQIIRNDMENCAELLIEAAINGGGSDNITAVVLCNL